MVMEKNTIKFFFKELKKGSSSQDGGVGGHTVLPCTTRRRTTTNFKIKNNQNYQKIELYGSVTTKELKKKHSSKLIGGAEMDDRGGEDSQQGSSWQSGQSHICMRINWEEQLRSEADHAT